MRTLLLALLQIYLFVLIARALLSWFPMRPGTALATVHGGLVAVTEPVLADLEARHNVFPHVDYRVYAT